MEFFGLPNLRFSYLFVNPKAIVKTIYERWNNVASFAFSG